MRLDIKSRKTLESLCKSHGFRKLILFGSCADDTCHERSDIDIAVQGVSDMDYIDLVEAIKEYVFDYDDSRVMSSALSADFNRLFELAWKTMKEYMDKELLITQA